MCVWMFVWVCVPGFVNVCKWKRREKVWEGVGSLALGGRGWAVYRFLWCHPSIQRHQQRFVESRTRKGNNFRDTFANRLLAGATLILQRNNLAFLCRSQSGSHTGTRLTCVLYVITALCPVAGSCATQGIIKVLIQCHHTFGRTRNLSLLALPFMTPRVCSGEFLKHFTL